MIDVFGITWSLLRACKIPVLENDRERLKSRWSRAILLLGEAGIGLLGLRNMADLGFENLCLVGQIIDSVQCPPRVHLEEKSLVRVIL